MRLRIVFFLVSTLLIGLGVFRYLSLPKELPKEYVPLLQTTVSLEGTVAGEPDIRESSQRVPIRVVYEGVETTVLAVAERYPRVQVGEQVRLSGKLVLPESFITDTGRTFRYDTFLAKDGIFALIQRARIESLESPSEISAHFTNVLLSIKQSFQHGLSMALPEPAASLASGLITGGKQGLGPELLDVFVITGLVHIVVLSGYNVMIVAEAVMRMFGFLSRRMAAFAALITISLFVLAAGAGAASVRAGIMAAIAMTARMTGKTYAVLRALALAALIMLLHNPLLLLHDPGFQLSFLATLGIVLGVPLIEPAFLGIKSIFWREIITSSLAAQVAVLPLLLYQTGLFSVVSVPANLMVLPVVPLAMALATFAVLPALLIPALAPLFGLPAYAVLTYCIEVARFFASLPGAALSIPQFPFWLVVLAYILMGWWVYIKHKNPAPTERKVLT